MALPIRWAVVSLPATWSCCRMLRISSSLSGRGPSSVSNSAVTRVVSMSSLGSRRRSAARSRKYSCSSTPARRTARSFLWRSRAFNPANGVIRSSLEISQLGSRDADLIGDHRHRQLVGEPPGEVDLAVIDEAIDQFGYKLADVAFHAHHSPGRQRPVDERAIAGVMRRIGRQQGRHVCAIECPAKLPELVIDRFVPVREAGFRLRSAWPTSRSRGRGRLPGAGRSC